MWKRDLTDEQLELLNGLLPPLPRRKNGCSRPWKDSRAVFNGILWVARTAAQKELPKPLLGDRAMTVILCISNWSPKGSS